MAAKAVPKAFLPPPLTRLSRGRLQVVYNRTYQRSWRVFDAAHKDPLQLAKGVARLLTGQHKPVYRPSDDCGDNVIVLNCDKMKYTKDDALSRRWRTDSGFPGGKKVHTVDTLMAKNPAHLFTKEVWGVLPNNGLRRRRIMRLKTFGGNSHPFLDQVRPPTTAEAQARQEKWASIQRDLETRRAAAGASFAAADVAHLRLHGEPSAELFARLRADASAPIDDEFHQNFIATRKWYKNAWWSNKNRKGRKYYGGSPYFPFFIRQKARRAELRANVAQIKDDRDALIAKMQTVLGVSKTMLPPLRWVPNPKAADYDAQVATSARHAPSDPKKVFDASKNVVTASPSAAGLPSP